MKLPLSYAVPAVLLVATGIFAANACGGEDSASSNATTAGPGAGGNTAGSGTATGTGQGGGTTGTGNYDCAAPTGDVPLLTLAPVVTSGLSNPVLVKGAGADTTRLYVLEQNSGRIRLIKNGALEATPFADIKAGSGNNFGATDERGLLGLAFHPQYAQNGRFFVHYTDSAGDTTIAEYHTTGNGDVADAAPVGIILTVDQPEANHNGGSIEFGSDGNLYIFLGDGGGGGDSHGTIGNGQNLDTLLGKVLRINVDGAAPYTVPAGNMPGGKPEIWDYGVRNPWRDSFDPCTGDLYIGDVGQELWEEVDVEPALQGNKNYGWRCREGLHAFNDNCGPNAASAVDPVIEFQQTAQNENCSMIGGYVYRSSAIPGLRGTYFYGDICSGNIYSFVYEGGVATQATDRTAELGSYGTSISSFGQDGAGEVYVVDYAGGIYRIAAQ
jgi:glucose/arabinose dehydrogenase